MSARTRELPRRSCLSVPGSSEKMLGKAPASRRHGVPRPRRLGVAAREGGRAPGRQCDQDPGLGRQVLCVRINAWDTEWTVFDVIEVVGQAGIRLEEVMLPKAVGSRGDRARPAAVAGRDQGGSPRRAHRHRGADRDDPRPDQRRGDLRGVAPTRDHHLRSRRLRRVHGDAGAHRRRADPRVPGRPLPLRVLEDLDGGASERPPGDRRPVPEDPQPGACDYCQRTKVLGYDSKWALHPAKSTSSTVFSPTQEQFDRVDILDAYGDHEGERKGAVMFGDEMIDEASRKMATKFVRRSERAGFRRSALRAAGPVLSGIEAVCSTQACSCFRPTVIGPLLAPMAPTRRPSRWCALRGDAIPRHRRSGRRLARVRRSVRTSVRHRARTDEAAVILGVADCASGAGRSSSPWCVAHVARGWGSIGVVPTGRQIESVLGRFGVCQVGEGEGVPVVIIVDSTIVGVAKPDPAIFSFALDVSM